MSKGGACDICATVHGCIFQFFGGRMTSRGQCPRGGGGACECPRVGVFVIFWRADDATRTINVQGGGGCL